MPEERQLVNFFELPDIWQLEAISNNGERATEEKYIMPKEDQDPSTHALLDLSECMKYSHEDYDGIIGVSNCLAIGVNLSDCGEGCTITYLS